MTTCVAMLGLGRGKETRHGPTVEQMEAGSRGRKDKGDEGEGEEKLVFRLEGACNDLCCDGNVNGYWVGFIW